MKTKFYLFIFAACAGLATRPSRAESSRASAAESGATLTEKKDGLIENRKFEDPHTLTDPKLRADDGSLSHYSMKGNLTYLGPTLGDISAPDQPNPDGVVGNFAQAIKGSVMARYRIDSNSSISAGTGISLNHPFHGFDRTDANNPFIAYDFSLRAAGLQMRNSPGLTLATVPNYTAVGEVGGLTWDNSLVYAIGGSRFAAALDTNFSYWIFNRAYRSGSVKSGGDGLATQYSISTYPGVKYNVTDSFSVNASTGFQFYNPRLDSSAIWSRTALVRAGVGYAYRRDVYFAPYIQSYLTNLAADATSINASAIVNLL